MAILSLAGRITKCGRPNLQLKPIHIASICAGAVVIGASALMALLMPPWLAALTLLALLIVAPPFLDFMAGTFEPFEIRNAFLVGYFFQFVVSALTSLLGEPRYYVGRARFASVAPTATLWSCLALACFYIGYYWRRNKAPMKSGIVDDWDCQRALAVAVSFLSLTLIVFAIFLAECGGLFAVLTNLSELNRLLFGRYYFALALRSLPFVATIILFTEARFRGGWRWLATLASFAFLTVETAILGERGPILFNLLALALVCWHTVGSGPGLPRWATILLAPAAIAGIVLAFEGATILRFSNLQGVDSDSLTGLFSSPLARNAGIAAAARGAAGRFEGMEVLGIILKRTGRTVPYDEGASLTDALTMMVPRALWAGKPFNSGIRVERLFLDNVAGDDLASSPSPTLPGEFYWNFGWPGIVLGMLAAGFGAARANSYFRRRATTSALLIYSGFFLCFFGISDGGLGGWAITLLSYIGPAALADWLMRR